MPAFLWLPYIDCHSVLAVSATRTGSLYQLSCPGNLLHCCHSKYRMPGSRRSRRLKCIVFAVWEVEPHSGTCLMACQLLRWACMSAGAVQLDEAAMQQLQQRGYDRDLVVESLLAGDCNAATAAYHLMQQALAMKRDPPGSIIQQSPQLRSNQTDTAVHEKRIDTPVRILSRPQSGHTAGIPAYRPTYVVLEVAGTSAGCDKRHKQHAGQHVGDDSAETLHHAAALHANNQC